MYIALYKETYPKSQYITSEGEVKLTYKQVLQFLNSSINDIKYTYTVVFDKRLLEKNELFVKEHHNTLSFNGKYFSVFETAKGEPWNWTWDEVNVGQYIGQCSAVMVYSNTYIDGNLYA
jgi:hypothetical protein